jgi:hypothetical protein
MTNEFKMFDDREPQSDKVEDKKPIKIKFGHARKLIDYSEQKKARPEKIEEIKNLRINRGQLHVHNFPEIRKLEKIYY